MYKGDLILREINYNKRRVKWSYDVVADRTGKYEKGTILPCRVVMKHLTLGYKVELLNDKDESVCLLGKLD